MSRSSRTSSTALKSRPDDDPAAGRPRPRRNHRPATVRSANTTSDWHPLERTAFRGFRLTPTGLIFVGVTVLLCIAALNTESNLLFLVFALCTSGPIINFLVVWRRVRRLSIRRIAPATTLCGQAFGVRYALRADRRLGRTFGVTIRESNIAAGVRVADALCAVVPPSEPVVVETPGIADRRGTHDLDRVRVESAMPFGLVRRVLEARVPHRIVVYPRLGGLLRPVLPSGQSTDTGGMARAQLSRRMPDEFFGLREYRTGDNPHWIHWRRSARTGELLVREMATRRARELLLVVDHRCTVRPDDRETLVSCAATLACDALERGFRVGLIGLAGDLLVLAPVGGRSHRERLLYELARLHGEPPDRPTAALHRLRWPETRGATCVYLAACDDPEAKAVAHVLRSRCGVLRVLTAGTDELDASFRMTSSDGRARGGRS